MVDPILKWAGGKRQLLDELYARFPAEYENYHEPFIGGGAVFFDLAPVAGSVNDMNERLINFYKQVRDRPKELITRCRQFKPPEAPPDPGRERAEAKNYYYQQRWIFNRRPRGDDFDPLEEAALLLYLNRTCFNGLYRENSDGEFNVSIGDYNNPDWVRGQQVRAASQTLSAIDISATDFEYVRDVATAGDLVYFDPPYEPLSQTANFNEYAADGFGRDDQRRLLRLVRELDERGVHIVLSNSAVTYDMYTEAGFYVATVGAKRAINSDGGNRGEVEEVIATNVPPDERYSGGQQMLTDF